MREIKEAKPSLTTLIETLEEMALGKFSDSTVSTTGIGGIGLKPGNQAALFLVELDNFLTSWKDRTQGWLGGLRKEKDNLRDHQHYFHGDKCVICDKPWTA